MRLLEEVMRSLVQDMLRVVLLLNEAGKGPFPILGGGWYLGIKAIILQVSLDVFASTPRRVR